MCNGILMKSCHERTKGIGAGGVFGIINECSVIVFMCWAIGSFLHWTSHLQCCVLIMHSVVVKVQIGLAVYIEIQTNTILLWKCLNCVHTSHRVG